WPPPNGISTVCARAGPRPSRPRRCISTCCAISGAFTRTSVRSPTPCSMPQANSLPIAVPRLIWPRYPRRCTAADESAVQRLRRLAAMLDDQHDVSDVDDRGCRLADDDDGLTFGD